MMQVVVFLGVLCLLTSGQRPPDFVRQRDGRIRVVAQGFPGVSKVTLTVGEQGKQTIIGLTHSHADGYWRAYIPDVTSENDVMPHYVIKYHYDGEVHKTKGLMRLSNEVKKGVAPVTPRYLQRRLTTVFFDDFSSGRIDTSKWKIAVTGDGGGNEEFNMYTPEPANAYVKDKTLYIRPTLTVDHLGNDFLAKGNLDVNAIWGKCTHNDRNGCHLQGVGKIPPIMSAKLESTGHIKYGKVVVTAKMPKGDWIWPAIWMMPTESHYGMWPRSGEIDIIECRGNRDYHTWDGKPLGVDFDHVNIHYGPTWYNKKNHEDGYQIKGTTFGDGFHSYWMDWTENYIRLGVDDHTIMAWDTPSGGYWQEGHFQGDNPWTNGGKDAPFDRPFYLILNVAIGGRWFWEANINANYRQPWKDNSNNKFTEFWNARHLWEPTWQGEDTALKIYSVKMEQY